MEREYKLLGGDMNKTKLTSIQSLRAIAFIFIFLSHVEIISTGPIGVSIFLVLSGFCMVYAYMDRVESIPNGNKIDCIRFCIKKVKRLYPLHFCTLLLIALVKILQLVFCEAALERYAEQGYYFVLNIFLLQSWIPWRDGYFSFNAVSWYLSTIIFSYFLFPGLCGYLRKANSRSVKIFTIVVAGLLIIVAAILDIGQQYFGWTSGFLKWVTYISPIYRFGDFALGSVAGYYFLMNKVRPKKTVYTLIEILTITVMIIQIIIYDGGLHTSNWMLSLFWLPTSLILVYLFARNGGILSTYFSRCNFFVWIGNISGEAFLIHQIVIKAAEIFIKNIYILTVVAFIVTIVSAYVWNFMFKRRKIW